VFVGLRILVTTSACPLLITSISHLVHSTSILDFFPFCSGRVRHFSPHLTSLVLLFSNGDGVNILFSPFQRHLPLGIRYRHRRRRQQNAYSPQCHRSHHLRIHRNRCANCRRSRSPPSPSSRNRRTRILSRVILSPLHPLMYHFFLSFQFSGSIGTMQASASARFCRGGSMRPPRKCEE
jgi:hypothetical protein